MSRMTKHRRDESELERVAECGWMFTLRYVLLCEAVAPSSRLAKWTTALGAAGAGYLLKYW
jgi:hypothetical protein